MQLPFSRPSLSLPFPRHIWFILAFVFILIHNLLERTSGSSERRFDTKQIHFATRDALQAPRQMYVDFQYYPSLADQSIASIMSCGIQTSATSKVVAIKEQITAKEEQITEHRKNIEALEAVIKTLRDEEQAEEETRTEKKHKLLAWLEDVRPPGISEGQNFPKITNSRRLGL